MNGLWEERPMREADRMTLSSVSARHRSLVYAASVFGLTLLFHGADHARRGFEVITPQVYWGGTALGLVALAAIALVFVGHRSAPLIAVITGFVTAFLVTASHLLPPWSAFSDAYLGSDVDALSWMAALSEIAGASVFGIVGAYVLRARQQIGR
jgi:hypothetical protein